MQEKRQQWPWACTWLVLVLVLVLRLALAIPAWAQVVRGGEEGPLPPATRLQVTQTLTIAVCGDTCDCGTAALVSKESAICSVRSTTGSCEVGSGECCVCALTNTVAVCGDTCDCSDAVLLTRVSAPCTVTSSAGPCSASSGQCCVCVPN